MGPPRYQGMDFPRDLSPVHSSVSTAYHGAGAAAAAANPNISFDSYSFENVSLHEQPPLSPAPPREGFGSRLLSSLSTAPPAAAALSRSGSVLHSRARSWAASIPRLNPSSSNSSTPEKPPSQQKNRLFGELFNGDSARVQLGVPTSPDKEKDQEEFTMEYRPVFTERPNLRHQRTSTSITTTSSNGNSNRKSSWFGRKASTPVMSAAAAAAKVEDELLTLNINKTLFPHGPADPLSPQAFNDLLLNATALLHRMQTAYKQKVDYIASIQPEIEAQREEVEEANTRSEHLKMQLEDIGRQAQEQRQVNEELVLQLGKEREMVQELRQDASASIRLVRNNNDTPDTDTDGESPHRRKRRSGGSGSDSGFESDADTASIFSQTTQARSIITMDGLHSPRFQPAPPIRVPAVYPCIPGRTNSMEKLQAENGDLHRRVEEMRHQLQDCIDFVDCIGGS